MSNNLTLYSLIWEHQDINVNDYIYPRVPENTLSTEDKTIPRICTSESIDGCLTGIGVSHIGINGLKELIDQGKEPKDINLFNILFPFTIVKFNINKKSPDVLLSGKVIEYGVDDAFHSGETWITQPTKPCEISHKWLVNGDVEKTFLLHNGFKHLFYTISNSQWSDEKRTPNKTFLKNILQVTKEWMIDDGWGIENTSKEDNLLNYEPLDTKINSAEKKKSSSLQNTEYNNEFITAKERD